MDESVADDWALFSRVFTASPLAMAINAIPGGQYLDANDAFCRLIGYTRQEVVGRRAVDLGLVPADRREPVFQRLVRDGYLANAPIRLTVRDGSYRDLIISAQIEELNGQRCVVSIMQDLTARFETQAELRSSEIRWRTFFEAIPLPVWIFDLETLRILDANPAACEHYGYEREELLQLTLLDVRPEEERERFARFVPELHDEPGQIGVWKHQKKDGTRIDVAVHGYNFELDGRRVRLAVLKDVTAQLANERALRTSEEQLNTLTSLVTDAIWDWDIGRDVVTRSDGLRNLFGSAVVPSQEIDWWFENLHPDDREAVVSSFRRAVGSDARYWAAEYRLQRADGRYATVLDRAEIIRDDEGQPLRMIGALVDITQQLEVAEAAALAAAEERERLANELHDSVTQSLYSVTLIAEAARRQAQSGQQADAERFIERLSMLANKALREMRLLVYQLRPASLAEEGLAGALLHRLEAVEQRAGVQYRLECEHEAAIPEAQKLELYEMAQEALNNALNHAAASSVRVRIEPLDGRVQLTVTDNGRGFEPEEALALGKGLDRIRQRAREQGGTLHVESADGAGTTIRVELPLT